MENNSSGIILIIIGIFIYFIPSMIAQRTIYASGIFLLNLFLGWTGLGWLAALIWAVSAPKNEAYLNKQQPEYGTFIYTCEKCGNKDSHFKKINPYRCSKCNAEHWY